MADFKPRASTSMRSPMMLALAMASMVAPDFHGMSTPEVRSLGATTYTPPPTREERARNDPRSDRSEARRARKKREHAKSRKPERQRRKANRR